MITFYVVRFIFGFTERFLNNCFPYGKYYSNKPFKDYYLNMFTNRIQKIDIMLLLEHIFIFEVEHVKQFKWS